MQPTEVEIRLWTAIKAGFGFATGTTLFGLFILVVVALALTFMRR